MGGHMFDLNNPAFDKRWGLFLGDTVSYMKILLVTDYGKKITGFGAVNFFPNERNLYFKWNCILDRYQLLNVPNLTQYLQHAIQIANKRKSGSKTWTCPKNVQTDI